MPSTEFLHHTYPLSEKEKEKGIPFHELFLAAGTVASTAHLSDL